MPYRRTLTATLAGAVLVLAPAAPAAGHGAPDDPLSRTLACAPGGEYEQAEVCRAALAGSGRDAFVDWDYLRVPGVDGRDRELIPDGRLCSGGIDAFAGLDLARDDWPATELTPGAEITFSYLTTIPHQGTFRLYVTTDDHNPAAPLSWSELEPEPFLTVTDPAVVDGAYQLPGRLPEDKSGRHLIYTIWQNSDNPDTYYSCSDVIFAAAPEPEPTGTAPPTSPAATPPAATPLAAVRPTSDELLPRALGGAAGALAVLALTVGLMFRRRRGGRRSLS